MSTRLRLLLALTVLTCLALPAVPALAQSDDLDCDDFDSQAEAQTELEADPSDPNDLDGDEDGQACENYDGYPAGGSDDPGTAETGTVRAPTRVDTGGGGTADRDGTVPMTLVGGMAVAGFAAIAWLERRRRAHS